MNPELNIRPVSLDDAGKLLSIYAPYVTDTAITFEYDVPSLSEFRERIHKIVTLYPYLAAFRGGELMGYAYAFTFKGRKAYDWSVETSIYVKKDSRGQGIGSRLYEELERYLKKQNVCNLCACITYPNPESIAFHEKHGYTTVAHFHKSGYKFDAWHDMIWMEKFINEHTACQKPFIPIKEVL